MTRHHSRHLFDMLAEVPDPRKKKGRRHALKAILGALVVGLLCQQKGYTRIAKWLRTQYALAKALGFTKQKVPCPATFHNTLKRLDTQALENVLTRWVSTVMRDLPPPASRLVAVAIDGKTLGGSRDKDTPQQHLLAAVSHDLGVVLAECAVSEKTNEIPVSKQLLKAFEVTEKVITTDALLTQRTFCQEILEHQADYLLPLKANQKCLYEDIKDLFKPFSETDDIDLETRRFQTLHAEEVAHFDQHTTTETGHGFFTQRTLRTSTCLNTYLNWPGPAQVYEYHIQQECLSTRKKTSEKQYGITSLAPEDARAAELLDCRRKHWTIENKLHWVRDVVFAEDASLARKGNLPHAMAALRNTALAVLRFEGYTKISDKIREFAAKPILAVKLIQP